MTPSEIAAKARAMETTEDLLSLINEIRMTYDHRNRKPISIGELKHFSYPGSDVERYRNFTIPKKSGGERVISAPVAKLKAILWPLNEILKSLYYPRACVMGFAEGRSVADNAKAHLCRNYVLNLDLKDFFPSIVKGRVWKRLTLKPYCFTDEVATVIAGLCTMKVVDEGGAARFVLPQGAPTSPILTNMICERLDRRLTGVAARFDLRYTRYADDMTFSCMRSTLSLKKEAYAEIMRVIEGQGFRVNEAKTRLQKRGSRIEVTGLVLSRKVNVTRKYRRDLDQILYVWEKFGYTAAYIRAMEARSSAKRGRPSLEAIVRGKLDFLKMVKGDTDRVYLKYKGAYDRCMAAMEKASFVGERCTFVSTCTLPSFRQRFPGALRIERTDEGVEASIVLGGKTYGVSVSGKVVDCVFDPDLEGLAYVSVCETERGVIWIIHSSLPAKTPKLALHMPMNDFLDTWEKYGLDAAMKADDDFAKGTLGIVHLEDA